MGSVVNLRASVRDSGIIFLLLIGVLMAVFCFISFSTPGVLTRFPRVISTVGLVLVLASLGISLGAGRKPSDGVLECPSEENYEKAKRTSWFITAGWLLGYAVAIPSIGFFPGTILVTVGLGKTFGGGLRRLVVFALVWSTTIVLVFERLLHVPLPRGWIFVRIGLG